jgi:hypothetical protein
MNYKNWTTEENNLLRKLIEGGSNYKKIAHLFNRNKNACQAHGIAIGLKCLSKSRRKYSLDDNFWTIPNKINSYYAGFSSADSSVRKRGNNGNYRLQIQERDVEFLKTFIKYIGFNGKIYYSTFENCGGSISNAVAINTHSMKWIDDLEKNFYIIPRKASRLKVPPIDEKYFWCWLKGLYCGDGCIHFREIKGQNRTNPYPNLSMNIVSCSGDFLEDIARRIKTKFEQNCLRLYNKDNNIHGWNFCSVKRGSGTNAYTLSINGLRAAVLFDYLSQIQGTPHLKRKWEQPLVLQHVSNLKQKYPHLFKTFEFNDELNINCPELPKNKLEIPNSSPTI